MLLLAKELIALIQSNETEDSFNIWFQKFFPKLYKYMKYDGNLQGCQEMDGSIEDELIDFVEQSCTKFGELVMKLESDSAMLGWYVEVYEIFDYFIELGSDIEEYCLESNFDQIFFYYQKNTSISDLVIFIANDYKHLLGFS